MVLLGFGAFVVLPGADASASPLLRGLALAATALLVALASWPGTCSACR